MLYFLYLLKGGEPTLPGWRRAINCLCGLETQNVNQQVAAPPRKSPQEEATEAAEFIQEDPFWYR